MAKQAEIIKDGTVVEALPRSLYRVELEKSGHKLLAYMSGRMKSYKINVICGDRVKVAISPYDLERGRITFRYNADKNK